MTLASGKVRSRLRGNGPRILSKADGTNSDDGSPHRISHRRPFDKLRDRLDRPSVGAGFNPVRYAMTVYADRSGQTRMSAPPSHRLLHVVGASKSGRAAFSVVTRASRAGGESMPQ